MRYDHLLPVGSLVKVEGEEQRLMIIGCNMQDERTGRIYDYCACFYPVGFLSPDQVAQFNHRDIEIIYSVGYLDEESRAFQQEAVRENMKLRTGVMTVDELLGTGRSGI